MGYIESTSSVHVLLNSAVERKTSEKFASPENSPSASALRPIKHTNDHVSLVLFSPLIQACSISPEH